jgi:MinD-like ATPase involved in chromosome partitioning or flagellar assembly
MDGPAPDHGAGGRPLTRRELRSRGAEAVDTPGPWSLDPTGGATPDEVGRPRQNGSHALADPTTDEPAADEPPADEPAADGLAADGLAADGLAADSWELAVGWSLRHELPANLPPEPETEIDDVRWDPVVPQQADRPPEGTPEAREPGPGALGGLWQGGGPSDLAVGEPFDAPDDVPGEDDLDEPSAGTPERDSAEGDAEGPPRRISVLGTGGPTTGRPAAWHPPAPMTSTPVDSLPLAPGSPDALPSAAASPDPHGESLPDVLPDEPDDDAELRDDLFGPVHGTPEDTADVTAPTGRRAARGVEEWGPPELAASGATAASAPARPAGLPTLDDLLATRRSAPQGPAEWGWRGTVRRITGGIIAPAPGAAEQLDREAVASVQRSLDGPRTVVVINPKGGAHKTTATLLIAATFGRHRGGYTLAWDNNETRGTLGWRSRHIQHHNTAVDLLDDLERFTDPGSSRVGDLDNYVRSQASAQFDVLASDEDAASAASIDGFAFRALHRTLARFYRVLVIDTGNNMRASNWQAAIEAADQVVIVSTMREDTAQSAAWALDALRATGHADVVRKAVTVLSQPAPRRDAELAARLHDHFGRLTRTVLEVPYDPSLVAGGPIDHDALSEQSRRAWLHVTAAVADGL